MEQIGASKQSGRLEFLDAARAIAALIVVFYHALAGRTPFLREWLLTRENLGSVGVYIFFFVSGFIIPVSMEKKSHLDFWRARFFRLFPAYWAVMGLTLIFSAFGFLTIDPIFFSWAPKTYFVNAAMLALGSHPPRLVGVAWTLTIELAFYVLCSLLKMVGLLPRRLLTAWLSILCYALLLAAASLHLYPAHHFKGEWGGLFLTAFVGAVFYEVDSGKLPRHVLYPLVPAVLAITFVGVHFESLTVLAVAASSDGPKPLYASWLLATVFFCLMFALRQRDFPAPLLWLGRISYSLYLMHGLILPLLYDRLLRLPLSAAAILVTCLSIVVAEISYRLIEKPSIRLGRRFSRQRSLTAVPNAS